MSEEPLIAVSGLTKLYAGESVRALADISFSLAAREVVAVMGPSGCGKSTLLGILGALEDPTSGEVRFEGRELREHRPLHELRAKAVGFVFQFHHLISTMTLLENVEAPMRALGVPRATRRERATRLLGEVGLGHRLAFFPTRVSGGERQRAAIARALANGPRLVLADEPTGNLDTATGHVVMDLLLRRCREVGAALLVATHNPEVALRADRILNMRDGRLLTAEPSAASPDTVGESTPERQGGVDDGVG